MGEAAGATSYRLGHGYIGFLILPDRKLTQRRLHSEDTVRVSARRRRANKKRHGLQKRTLMGLNGIGGGATGAGSRAGGWAEA